MNDENKALLGSFLLQVAAIPEGQKLLQALNDGEPVVLEAKNGKKALDFDWLLGLLPKLGDFLPLIISIFTGGFSPQLIIALIQVIAKLFGVSESTARAMMQQALETSSSQGGT